MKALMIFAISIIVTCWAFAPAVLCDTYVGGLISSNTNWNLAGSPYIVTNGVLVNSGVTLTIDPGVEIRFNSSLSLQIDGELIAIGTETDTIVFTSNQESPAAGDWGYILFTDNSTDATYDIDGSYLSGSAMKYCIVEYTGGSYGAIRTESSSPYIFRCVIRINSQSGIYIWEGGSPVVNNCVIRNNSNCGIRMYSGSSQIIGNNICFNYTSLIGGGIWCSNPTDVKISGNNIHNNWSDDDGGAIWINYPSGVIEGNIISENTSVADGGGIWVGDGGCNILNNIFTGNSAQEGGAIYAVSRYTAVIDGNVFANNTASEIGGAIRMDNYSGQSSAFYHVKNNTIVNNTCSGWGAGGLNVSAYSGTSLIENNNVVGNFGDGSGGLHSHTNNCTVTGNNIYGNAPVDLINLNSQGTPNVNAINCWWGTTIDSEIQTNIFDWFDNSSIGIVDYIPFLMTPDTIAPPIPPEGIDTVEIGDDYVSIYWLSSPIGDLAGYRVYYGTDSTGFAYSDTVDVGFDTTYTLANLIPGELFYVIVTCYDNYGNESWYSLRLEVIAGPSVAVEEESEVGLPCGFSLGQNHPNPFNPSTRIDYSVPAKSHVAIEVFNILGNKVVTLVDEEKAAGDYRIQWDGVDADGFRVSSGIYLYHFRAGAYSESKKMLLLK